MKWIKCSSNHVLLFPYFSMNACLIFRSFSALESVSGMSYDKVLSSQTTKLPFNSTFSAQSLFSSPYFFNSAHDSNSLHQAAGSELSSPYGLKLIHDPWSFPSGILSWSSSIFVANSKIWSCSPVSSLVRSVMTVFIFSVKSFWCLFQLTCKSSILFWTCFSTRSNWSLLMVAVAHRQF